MSELKDWKSLMPAYVRFLMKSIDFNANQILTRYGLKASYMPYIITLNIFGKATMKELSEKTGTDKSNTTRIISELRSKGIVTDDRKSSNSKKYNVFLTDFGIDIATKTKIEFESSLDELFSDISPEELETLMSIMRKTIEKLRLTCKCIPDDIQLLKPDTEM